MNDIIERTAKAIAAKQYATPWDHLMSHQRDAFYGMAKTAIEEYQKALWVSYFDPDDRGSPSHLSE